MREVEKEKEAPSLENEVKEASFLTSILAGEVEVEKDASSSILLDLDLDPMEVEEEASSSEIEDGVREVDQRRAQRRVRHAPSQDRGRQGGEGQIREDVGQGGGGGWLDDLGFLSEEEVHECTWHAHGRTRR